MLPFLWGTHYGSASMGSPSDKLKWGPRSLALPTPSCLLSTPRSRLNAHYGHSIVGHVNAGLPCPGNVGSRRGCCPRNLDLDKGLV